MRASAYPVLCQLARALVLAVAEKFDDAALVRCQSEVQKYISVESFKSFVMR